MRPSLPQHDALDLGTAARAGFAITLVNLEVILILPAAVHPVYAGAIAPDSRFQHPANAAQQCGGLLAADPAGAE